MFIMKKFLHIFLVFTILFVQSTAVLAAEVPKLYGNVEQNLELVNSVGDKILKANNLSTHIKFLVSNEDHVNAYANIEDEVYVYAGLLKVVETEDELAGVIAHEVGHIVKKHVIKQSILQMVIYPVAASVKYISSKIWLNKLAEFAGTLTVMKASRSAEYEADATGADLMVKAGYNPLGLVSVLNKISANHLDIISTHPSADKRLVKLYNHIAVKYPEAAKAGYNTESYAKFREYMDAVERN